MICGKRIVASRAPREREPLKLELQHLVELSARAADSLVSGESAKRALDLALQITLRCRALPLKDALGNVAHHVDCRRGERRRACREESGGGLARVNPATRIQPTDDVQPLHTRVDAYFLARAARKWPLRGWTGF